MREKFVPRKKRGTFTPKKQKRRTWKYQIYFSHFCQRMPFYRLRQENRLNLKMRRCVIIILMVFSFQIEEAANTIYLLLENLFCTVLTRIRWWSDQVTSRSRCLSLINNWYKSTSGARTVECLYLNNWALGPWLPISSGGQSGLLRKDWKLSPNFSNYPPFHTSITETLRGYKIWFFHVYWPHLCQSQAHTVITFLGGPNVFPEGATWAGRIVNFTLRNSKRNKKVLDFLLRSKPSIQGECPVCAFDATGLVGLSGNIRIPNLQSAPSCQWSEPKSTRQIHERISLSRFEKRKIERLVLFLISQ